MSGSEPVGPAPGSADTVQHRPGAAATSPFHGPLAFVTFCAVALVTMIAFEAMAVSTVMPRVAGDLEAVRSYGLAFSALLTAQLLGIVLAGVWTDRSGPLPGLYGGQVLLAVGSVVCAVAEHFTVFVLGRVVAGLGSGFLMVMLYVIIGRLYAESMRPRVFTLVSAAWIVPALLGAPLAAWLASTWSWRVVFWVVVLPVLVTLVMLGAQTRRFSARLQAIASSRDHGEHVRIAWTGLAIAVSAGVLQASTTGASAGRPASTVVALVAAAGVAASSPRLVPPGTWRMARGIPAVMCSRALLTAAFSGAMTYAPLYLVQERDLGLVRAGVLLSVGSLGWSLGAWVQGLGRFDGRRAGLVVLGGSCLAGALALLALVPAARLPVAVVVFPGVLGGVGMGLATASQSVLALSLAPVGNQGEVSSSLQLADVLGSVLGIAVASAVFAARHSETHDNAALFSGIWLGLAVVAALVVVAGRRIATARSEVSAHQGVPGRA